MLVSAKSLENFPRGCEAGRSASNFRDPPPTPRFANRVARMPAAAMMNGAGSTSRNPSTSMRYMRLRDKLVDVVDEAVVYAVDVD
jgi:hypothetical protein